MRMVSTLSLLTCLALTATVCAEDDQGQADLDQAIEKRLAVMSLRDLNDVVGLCESALAKGLSTENAEFANQLLAGALQERGTMVGQAIFAEAPPAQWPQMRQMALADLERAVDVEKTNPPAHLLIAKLHMLPGGDAKRAQAALQSVIEQSADDPQAQAEALVLRSRVQETPEAKLADLDRAIELAPADAATLRARGAVKLSQGKNEEALADFDKALEIDPEDAETHAARGLVQTELRNWDEARKSYDRAAELQPESADALVHRGRVNLLAGDENEAIKDFTEALQIDGENLAALALRAEVLQQAGQAEMAIDDLNKALRLRPGWIPALRMRGGLLFDSGKSAAAIADMELARKLQSDDPATLLQLGMMYSALHKPRKAIAMYDQALKFDDDNWLAHRGRADALLSVGKQGDAIAEYQAALELKPDDSGLLNNLAWVLATSPDDSIRDGKRAIELATKACDVTKYEQPHILSTLGAAHAETGDFENAIKWSKKAIELADESNREALEKELASYEKSEPVRELQVVSEEDEAEPLENSQPPGLFGEPRPEQEPPKSKPENAPDDVETATAPA